MGAVAQKAAGILYNSFLGPCGLACRRCLPLGLSVFRRVGGAPLVGPGFGASLRSLALALCARGGCENKKSQYNLCLSPFYSGVDNRHTVLYTCYCGKNGPKCAIFPLICQLSPGSSSLPRIAEKPPAVNQQGLLFCNFLEIVARVSRKCARNPLYSSLKIMSPIPSRSLVFALQISRLPLTGFRL